MGRDTSKMKSRPEFWEFERGRPGRVHAKPSVLAALLAHDLTFFCGLDESVEFKIAAFVEGRLKEHGWPDECVRCQQRYEHDMVVQLHNRDVGDTK